MDDNNQMNNEADAQHEQAPAIDPGVEIGRGGFPLDPNYNYDSMPDVKAYLTLLGTETNKVTWFLKGKADELSPEEEKAKVATDEAVVRGIKVLQGRRRRGDGLFVYDAPHSDDDKRRWEYLGMPWVPYTGILSMSRTERRDYVQKCLPYDYYSDEPFNPVNACLYLGNVRLHLSKQFTYYDPASIEFILLIRSRYGDAAHPLLILDSVLDGYTDEEVIPEDFDTDYILPDRRTVAWFVRKNASTGLPENELITD